MNNLATVSANTLFHFTSNIDYLIGILTNNFYPRLCLEDHSAFFPAQKKYLAELAMPMICFCDIPLSNIRNHVEVYGEYAIGLTKEWGKKNDISPVMYFWDNSISVRVIKSCFNSIDECLAKSNKHLQKEHYSDSIQKSKKDDLIISFSEEIGAIHNGLIEVMGFTKQYSGKFLRNGKEYQNICFYNEREWRYVPDILSFPPEIPTFMTKGQYLDLEQKRAENAKLEVDSLSLKFTPSDIKYIILSKEDEILPMIKKIEAIKSQKYSPEDVELLKTRIISMEQILQDF